MRALFFSILSLLLLGTSLFGEDAKLPTTLKELNQWYVEPSAGSNAATLYLKAFEAMNISDADTNSPNLPLIGLGTLPPVGQPMSGAMRAAIEEFVHRNEKAVSLLLDAAKRETSRYPIDLNGGWGTLLPHLIKIRKAARLLRLYVYTVNEDQATEGMLAGLALGRSLENEPLIISQLVRIACMKVVMDGLEDTLNRTSLTAASATRLRIILDQLAEREASGSALGRAWVGEYLSCASTFTHSSGELSALLKGNTNELKEISSSQYQTNLKAGDSLFLKESFDLVINAWKAPGPGRLKVSQLFEKREAEAKEKGFVISSLSLYRLNRVPPREVTLLASLRLTQTAVALERYRLDHDRHYPQYLGDLIPGYLPSAPKDPFNDLRLQYRRIGTGYRLWSVGPNRIDDGGVIKHFPDGDLVFNVVNAPN